MLTRICNLVKIECQDAHSHLHSPALPSTRSPSFLFLGAAVTSQKEATPPSRRHAAKLVHMVGSPAETRR